MSYWKFGGGYSYRTPNSKKTGWSKTLAGVPASAKKATGSTKKKTRKSSPKTTKKGGKKRMAKKKTKKSSGFRLPGGLGPKGILMGALGLLIAPRLIPVQSPGAHKLAAGLGLRALKLGGGGALASVGIMELVLQYGAGLIGGFGIGTNSGVAATGYDY